MDGVGTRSTRSRCAISLEEVRPTEFYPKENAATKAPLLPLEDSIVQPRWEDTGGSSDSEERVRPRRAAALKKQTEADSDDDFEASSESESESEETSDSDYEDESELKNKAKQLRERYGRNRKEVITVGERKSERSHGGPKIVDLTDQEIDMSFQHEERQVRRKERSKKKAKKKNKKANSLTRTNQMKRELKKEWKEWERKRKEKRLEKKQNGVTSKKTDIEEVDEYGGSINSESEDDHHWFCEVCVNGGHLILCDTCPRSWHPECIQLEVIPEGDWSCPKCTGAMPESESESESETSHEYLCQVCNDGGNVLLCDTCVCVYHLGCLDPPLTEIPEGDWQCPRCETSKMPLKGYVEQVLTWQWKQPLKKSDNCNSSPVKTMPQDEKSKEDKPTVGVQTSTPRQRMLFVKYRDMSYWNCEWISELQLEVFHRMRHHAFKKKWDLDEPPAAEDGSSGDGNGYHKKHIAVEDHDDLNERFYRWGVRPDWLQVSRIVDHDKKGLYLVKWRNLPYDKATWEDSDLIPKSVQNWQKHVDDYWCRRNRAESPVKSVKTPKPKKSQLKVKLKKQPDYIDESGGKLHPFQLEGFNWMRFSWAQDTNVILADEMGLGKTIQAIVFIYSLYKEGYTKGPFLLSVPLSTLLNWEREFQFWAPELYVVTYIGGKNTRAVIRERDFCFEKGVFHCKNPSKLPKGVKLKFDVLLTSYEFISHDAVLLKSIPWSIVVIDEAHRLKNQQSLFFRILREYKIDYRLLLTGTPLQNNLEELFNLLSFLEKDKFDDMESFLANFEEVSKEMQVSRLHEMLAPHMLRRLKTDVFKELPKKTELIVRIELSDLQKTLYKHVLMKNFTALNVRGHAAQTSLLNIMMDLRKCCNHPYLFPTAQTAAPLTRGGMYEGEALTAACGKLEVLRKMLAKLKEQGHRVLIFSQMTRMLNILEDFLAHCNYNYERIDGSIIGSLRQDSIDRFNDPSSKSFCFLLSTKAGGLGINLATADTVIIYDMDWNPHNDIQAFSRAHRIGQKNQVMIYRFVSKNTVEERMTEVCKKKMMLTELVIHHGMGNEKAESLSKQEVNEILKFGAEKLFNDDTGKVVYDDAMIEQLLDRTQKSEEVREQNFGLNDYLRSFKVASYTVKSEAVNDKAAAESETAEQGKSAGYWDQVLGSAYREHEERQRLEEEEQARRFGRGMRNRRKVNYAEIVIEDEVTRKTEEQAKATQPQVGTEEVEQKLDAKNEVVREESDSGDEVSIESLMKYEPYSSDSEESVSSPGEASSSLHALPEKNEDQLAACKMEELNEAAEEMLSGVTSTTAGLHQVAGSSAGPTSHATAGIQPPKKTNQKRSKKTSDTQGQFVKKKRKSVNGSSSVKSENGSVPTKTLEDLNTPLQHLAPSTSFQSVLPNFHGLKTGGEKDPQSENRKLDSQVKDATKAGAKFAGIIKKECENFDPSVDGLGTCRSPVKRKKQLPKKAKKQKQVKVLEKNSAVKPAFFVYRREVSCDVESDAIQEVTSNHCMSTAVQDSGSLMTVNARSGQQPLDIVAEDSSSLSRSSASSSILRYFKPYDSESSSCSPSLSRGRRHLFCSSQSSDCSLASGSSSTVSLDLSEGCFGYSSSSSTSSPVVGMAMTRIMNSIENVQPESCSSVPKRRKNHDAKHVEQRFIKSPKKKQQMLQQ